MENLAQPLSLDSSSAWSDLDDAYGCAGNIPSFLHDLSLEKTPALDELFQRIWHQGSIYSASIAALPHLISIKAATSFPGFTAVARQLDGFVDKEFCPTCPHCDAVLYVWPAHAGLAASAEDPVSTPSTLMLPLKPGLSKNSPHHDSISWLSTELVKSPSMNDVALRLPALYGTATCPECDEAFSLIDALIDDAASDC